MELPRTNTVWKTMFSDEDINFKKVYYKKIVTIKDTKLAETNFKILHSTLPCGENLLKWKIRDNSLCNICNVHEDVVHLIYGCAYANEIWNFVQRHLNIDIKVTDVILGTNLSNLENNVISIIVYLIYKEWLIFSTDGKVRSNDVCWRFYRNELKWYANVYSKVSNMVQLANTLTELESSM